jgi:hypothetical protein
LSLRIGLEKRMAIHEAALCQRSLTYEEFTRRALEQERIAQQKSITCKPAEQRLCLSQNHVPLTGPPAQNIETKLEIAIDKGKSARRPVISDNCRTKTEGKPKKKGLRQRLADVSDAWDEFQETRDRDAVYDYLRAVFSIVQHYGWKDRSKKLIRRAFKFAGLPVDMNADPFAVIIRCTCDQQLDRKTISKWSRALRYTARVKKRTPLKTFMKNRGGINACAELYSKYFGRGGR